MDNAETSFNNDAQHHSWILRTLPFVKRWPGELSAEAIKPFLQGAGGLREQRERLRVMKRCAVGSRQ